MRLWVLSIILIELYKFYNKNNEWSFCYKNDIIYSYSDFLKIDLIKFKIYDIFMLIFFLNIFYICIILQLIITVLIIIIRSTFTIKLSSSDNILFNIFIYTPFLNSLCISKLSIFNYKFFNRFVKVLFLNLINVIIWRFPRIVMEYSFISLNIIISFKKDPENFSIIKLKEIIKYIYKETFELNIEKLENLLNK